MGWQNDEVVASPKNAWEQDEVVGSPNEVPVARYGAGKKYQTPADASLFQKMLGIPEAAMSFATGIPAQAVGTAKGIYKSIAEGQYGTPKGVQTAEDVASQFAKAYTYQPRSQGGRELLSTAGDFINQSGIAGLGGLTEMQALANAAPVKGMPLYTAGEKTTKAINLANQLANKIGNTPVAQKAMAVSKSASQKLTEPFRGVKAGLYDPVMNQQDLIGSALTRNLGEENIPSIVQGLERKARTPGVEFSAAQRTGSETLAAMEDAIKSMRPESELGVQAAKNRTVLANKLRNIAGDELAMESARLARTEATKPMYEALENVGVMGGEELNKLLSRAQASGALEEAKNIAGIRGKKFEMPVIEEPSYRGISESDLAIPFETVKEMPKKVTLAQEPMSLSGYLKQTGGISKDYIMDITGEKNPRQSGAVVGLFTNKARSIDDAVQRAVEGQYLPESVLNDVDGGSGALIDLLSQEIQQRQKVYPMNFDQFGQEMAKQYNQTPQEVTRMVGEAAKTEAPRPAETIVGSRILGKDLINLKKGIDQQIKKEVPGSPRHIELMNLKKDYMDWMDRQGAGFLEANNKFAEMSKPINQMQAGKILSEKLIPATAEEVPTSLNAAQLAKALQNKDAIAKKVTGINGAKLDKLLTKDQLDTILAINSDASRMAEINKLGAGYGSPTARRLMATDFIGENFRQQAPAVSKIIDTLNKVPFINYATKGVGKVGNEIGDRLNKSMAVELDRMLASDPQGLAKALRNELNLIKNKQIKVDFNNPVAMPTVGPKDANAAKLGVILMNNPNMNQGE